MKGLTSMSMQTNLKQAKSPTNLSNMSSRNYQPKEENMPPIKYATYVHVVNTLKGAIHKLQLKDAIHRQELRKLQRTNENQKAYIQNLESKIEILEKARKNVTKLPLQETE